MSAPSYYSQYELVEDNVEYEYKTEYAYIAGGQNLVIIKTSRRRRIRSKTYEATIQDGVNEVPVPSYLSGSTLLEPNPESLSPIGNGTNQWHLDNVSYTKELSQPLSRVIRVTWAMTYAWEDVDESESA